MTILSKKNELIKYITDANKVFLVGHRDADLDAIASCIAMYSYAKSLDKDSYIIMDDIRIEPGTKKIYENYKSKINFIKSRDLEEKIDKKSLLIMLDTNKPVLLKNPDIINYFNKIVNIDHHDLGKNSIKANLSIIDTNSSSTCEMIAALFQDIEFELNKNLATALLSGIVLDTNNFTLKTTANTFKYCYYLTEKGANMEEVQYLLKQDLKSYIMRQKVITSVKTYKNIAITSGSNKIKYRREDIAKIADTILMFRNIKASFVVAKLDDDNIGISARSMGEINVGKILERFQGGGTEYVAAAKIENSTIQKVKEHLTELIRTID